MTKLKKSPDVAVDWTNLKAVIKHYDSFESWSFYISGTCKYTTGIAEIRNGIAYHEGEYYLPAGGNVNNWTAKSTKVFTDGFYYLNLYKRGYGYYSNQPSQNFANVFQLEDGPFTMAEIKAFEMRSKYQFTYAGSGPDPKDIAHIKSLNLQKVNKNELDFIKYYFCVLWAEQFPFKSGKLCISKWMNSTAQCSKGLIGINNSYHGHRSHGFNYGVLLEFRPSFSNEAKYYRSVYVNSIGDGLEKLADEIKDSLQSYSINW